jgi:hypothetical protein
VIISVLQYCHDTSVVEDQTDRFHDISCRSSSPRVATLPYYFATSISISTVGDADSVYPGLSQGDNGTNSECWQQKLCGLLDAAWAAPHAISSSPAWKKCSDKCAALGRLIEVRDSTQVTQVTLTGSQLAMLLLKLFAHCVFIIAGNTGSKMLVSFHPPPPCTSL